MALGMDLPILTTYERFEEPLAIFQQVNRHYWKTIGRSKVIDH
jgi:hypothetical protein